MVIYTKTWKLSEFTVITSTNTPICFILLNIKNLQLTCEKTYHLGDCQPHFFGFIFFSNDTDNRKLIGCRNYVVLISSGLPMLNTIFCGLRFAIREHNVSHNFLYTTKKTIVPP